MTNTEGNTGPYLQYAHARLCSVQDVNADVALTKDVDFSLLKEDEAKKLLLFIAKYPDILVNCSKTLEPCTMLQYLFELAHAISCKFQS